MALSIAATHAQQKEVNMEKLSADNVVSCKLTTPELQERKRTVIAELKKHVLEKVEAENGYRYKFEGSDKMLELLTDFIKTERLCCSFFDFTLSINRDRIAWLELDGPAGTKDFIKHEIDF